MTQMRSREEICHWLSLFVATAMDQELSGKIFQKDRSMLGRVVHMAIALHWVIGVDDPNFQRVVDYVEHRLAELGIPAE